MSVLEVITGITTAQNALTAVTMQGADSLTVRDTPPGAEPLLLQLWCKFQAAGTVRLRSPRLHDSTNGIRFDVTVDTPTPLLPWGFPVPLQRSDTLILENAGSGTAGDIDITSLLLYYPQLEGSNARLVTPGEIRGNVRHITTTENTIATGVTGSYTGAEALTAEIDQFKADADYALLGYLCDVECGTIAWRGADVSNFRIAGPGDEVNRDLTSDWFVRLSEEYNLPLVPVFSEANLAGTQIEAVQDEDGADVTVTSIFAELA